MSFKLDLISLDRSLSPQQNSSFSMNGKACAKIAAL